MGHPAQVGVLVGEPGCTQRAHKPHLPQLLFCLVVAFLHILSGPVQGLCDAMLGFYEEREGLREQAGPHASLSSGSWRAGLSVSVVPAAPQAAASGLSQCTRGEGP